LEARSPKYAAKRLINLSSYCLAAGLLTAAGGCSSVQTAKMDGSDSTASATATTAQDNSMPSDGFASLYAQWQAHINRPQVKLRSDIRSYIDCKPFREITALGKPALPLIMKKLEEGNAGGWNEAQFFLWHAARDISGTDLSKDKPPAGEQEMALRYIKWWTEQPR